MEHNSPNIIDMEMGLLARQDNTALRRAPSGQGRVELISKTRILGTPEHSDPVGLTKQRRRLLEGGLSRGGWCAGQSWADAWARKRRREAVVVWTDDGCPFACADAVVALVCVRLARQRRRIGCSGSRRRCDAMQARRR